MAIRSPDRAWARARVVAAQLAEGPHAARHHQLRLRRCPSSRAAGGRRSPGACPSMPVDPLPAQEDVAGGLHQPLAGDHPLALVAVRARPRVRGRARRRPASLAWRKQRILAVPAEQEDDPAAGADAAHADHLAGHVDDPNSREQGPPVRGQAAAVPLGAARGSAPPVAPAFRVRQQVGDRDDQRRVRRDPEPARRLTSVSFVERLQAVPGAGLGQRPGHSACGPAPRSCPRPAA